MDAGHEVSEVRERIADVLNIVEQCRADKEKAGCARVSRGPVEFFPSTVYQVMLFFFSFFVLECLGTCCLCCFVVVVVEFEEHGGGGQ